MCQRSTGTAFAKATILLSDAAPVSSRGSYTVGQTTKQVVDRDEEIMARIGRMVKGFSQLTAICDQTGPGGRIVAALAPQIGQLWPDRVGCGSKAKRAVQCTARFVSKLIR
ncbi:hypothetical protein [Pseudotabrizicola sp. 4114]|uniref:hypothetical protein n=1 Tax=Pseudotabrizicola sp. 4114 TaxID=2817731 RepID=UPI0032B7D3CF